MHVAGEDGDLVYHPILRSVSATPPSLRVRKDYLGNILRVSKLKRVYFVLHIYGSMGRTVHENGVSAHEDLVRDNRLRLRRSGRGIIII